MRWIRALRRSLVVAGLALFVATCRDGFEPGAMARISVAPVLPSEAALNAFGLTIDHVRFVVVRPFADTLADTTLALPPEVTELTLDLQVPLVQRPETLNISVIALAGSIPLFTGTSLVPVPTPLPPPEIPVTTYIGPAADSILILPRTPFILLNDSLRFQVQGFNGGAPVTQLFVAWETSDATVAPISSLGVLRAPGVRGAVRVRARTPSGAIDSVAAIFTPPATQLLALAGGGQIDTIGHLLGTPLEVQARAADGLGVGGVPVHFRALTGAGSVTDSVVVTDSAGRARTSVTLGGLIGGQTFEATVPALSGSPVTFSVVALAGPATQLLALAGDAQLATVATTLLTRPAVQLKDAAGNAVAGASVTFAVSGGGGILTGGTQLTNAAGIATVGSWTLGTIAGPNTLTASAAGVTPAVFTATGLAGAAATIVKLTGDLQSAIVNTVVPAAPQVRIADQFGNPVLGTTVSAAIASGGGNIANSAPLSDASGLASVGSWRLGTLVGANAVTVSATGLAGSPITFTATGLVDAVSQLTAFAGDGQAALVGNAVSINPAVRVSDQYGNAVGGVPVTFTVNLGGGTLATPATVTSDTAGIARSATWTLGLVAGLNTLNATASGLPTVTFSADGIASLASTIAAQGGTGQAGTVGTALGAAYAVVVKDLAGLPVAGVPVSWAVASGGGLITPVLDTTDGSGISTAVRTLGTSAGTQTATASVGGLSGSPVVFSSNALPGVAARLVKKSLDPQTGTVGLPVGAPPSVRVEDQYANGVPGVVVTFAVASGGGSVTGASVTSDAQANASVGSWTLGTVAGNNGLNATATGVPSVAFSASALAGAPTQLAFITQPSHTLAGNLMQPPVRVAFEDAFGNTVSNVGDTVSVQLSPTANGAKLIGATSVSATSGVATFDLGVDSASLGYTLAATTPKIAGSFPSAPFDIGGVLAGLLIDRLGPVAAALDPTTNRLYVPGTTAAAVEVIDADKLQPVTQIQGFESPFGIAVNSRTNMIYVTTLTGVVVIDGSRNAIVTTIPVFGAKGIAVDEELNRVYVAVTTDLQGPPGLASIDGSKNTVDITIPLPALPTGSGIGVVYNPNDRFVYVAMPGLGVAIVDPGGAKVVNVIDLAGAKGTYGLGLDVRTNILYATNQDENSLSVIDLAGRKEFTRLAVGRTPQGVGVDSDRGVVYVGNSGEATVSFVDGGKFNVVGTLTVGQTPKAAVVQPVTGRVFVPTFADDRVRVVQP